MKPHRQWGSTEIAEHTYSRAERTVAKCRDLNASHEAIVRAALDQVARPAAMAIVQKLHCEFLEQQQAATHAAPIDPGERHEPD
jgi:hypothetical protein